MEDFFRLTIFGKNFLIDEFKLSCGIDFDVEWRVGDKNGRMKTNGLQKSMGNGLVLDFVEQQKVYIDLLESGFLEFLIEAKEKFNIDRVNLGINSVFRCKDNSLISKAYWFEPNFMALCLRAGIYPTFYIQRGKWR